MKRTILITLILLMLLTGCSTGNKYASEAIQKDDQIIEFEITSTAYEKLIERMEKEENDEIVVLLKGGC